MHHSRVADTVTPDVTVLQSCPASERHGWLERCMHSVREWAQARHYAYHWVGDELFDRLPDDLRPSRHISPVIASDIARLVWMQDVLKQGCQNVVWLDADVLIFRPGQFSLADAPCAVGREVWVQADAAQRWRVHRKVHNAVMQASGGDDGHNSFIDFYCETAQRLVRANRGGMPAQFVGPKLLTALHNVVQLPVIECAGMLSPAVIDDLLMGGGDALACMLGKSKAPLHAANLCRSSVHGEQLEVAQMIRLIEQLLERPQLLDVA